MASKHTYLNHTADIAFDIEADTLNELFAEAFLGWRESVIDTNKFEGDIEINVSLAADSLEELLVEFLNEINFLLTVKKFAGLKLGQLNTNENIITLDVKLSGRNLDDAIELKEEIKAVTYHQMEIKNINGKYFVRVVFDI